MPELIERRERTVGTSLVRELNSLDFSVYIGGPLQAAVAAQNAASLAQVDFIQQVGFHHDNDGNPTDIVYVDFSFQKTPRPNDQGVIDGNPIEVTLRVPLLTIITIPALRIDEMTIDFNARLNSVETSNTESTFGVTASAGVNLRVVNIQASTSYQRKTTSGVEVERTYTMGVHVRVVNDEIPAGLDRILGLLESEIKEVDTDTLSRESRTRVQRRAVGGLS
ncbi:MAG: DUF2589 domain-containing protein [Bacteroidales bacterium]|jgi:hypothetical protein|nr:DUF2589 domain-containing protein [Bacteroidales bacterium]